MNRITVLVDPSDASRRCVFIDGRRALTYNGCVLTSTNRPMVQCEPSEREIADLFRMELL